MTIPNADTIADKGYEVEAISDKFYDYAEKVLEFGSDKYMLYQDYAAKLRDVAAELDDMATDFVNDSKEVA